MIPSIYPSIRKIFTWSDFVIFAFLSFTLHTQPPPPPPHPTSPRPPVILLFSALRLPSSISLFLSFFFAFPRLDVDLFAFPSIWLFLAPASLICSCVLIGCFRPHTHYSPPSVLRGCTGRWMGMGMQCRSSFCAHAGIVVCVCVWVSIIRKCVAVQIGSAGTM